MQFPLQSEKSHADFPQKTVEEPKWVTLVELNPIYVKLHHFPPIFSVGEKCPKNKNPWSFTPFKLVGFTPFLWKKKFLPRNFPKGPISLWAAWQHVGPGSWGPELTWKPWVNGPILVGDEATDRTIPNQNLKGSLVDLKVGTLMVNIAVNGMFFDLLDSTCPNFQRWFLGF